MRCLVLALAALTSAAAASTEMFPADIFPPLPIVALNSKNPRCREDSQTLLDNLHNSTAWAIRMWDASAKGVVGVLAGNVYNLGNFDACVAQVHPMRAQYCLATVTLHAGAARNAAEGSVWGKIKYNGDPSKLRRDVIYLALCVPASCSHGDVEASINLHLAEAGRNTSVSVAVGEGACQTNRQEERLSFGAIAFCVVVAVIAGVVIGSTVFDFYFTNGDDDDTQSNVTGYLLCFSMRKNFAEMPSRVDSDLNCIDGIRFLSMCLIILDHRIGNTISAPLQNYDYVEQQYSRLYSIFIYKGDLLVDTFFVISGILCIYILCLTLDKRKVPPVMAIVLRYVRLTPVYMLVVFFYVTLMYHVNDGPLWHLIVGAERDACVQTWWTNLLYINNYVKDDQLCMIQSWYLPCDTHFFIIALGVVMVLHKRPNTGICILAALIFASVLVPFLITYISRKAPLLYFYSDFLVTPRTHNVFQTMYTKSHARAGPYFVGLAAGYFLYRTKTIKKECEWKARAGLAISVLFCVVSVLPSTMFYDRDWKYDPLQAALYAGVHRTAWAVGISGIVVSIVFNKTSIIGAILSWSPFTSLSKLVYCQYLVHVAIQIVHLSSIRSPQHYNWLNTLSQALGDVCWSLIIALPLYLSVEAPIRLVARRFLQPRKSVELKPNREFGYLQKDFAEPREASADIVLPRCSSGNLVESRVIPA